MGSREDGLDRSSMSDRVDMGIGGFDHALNDTEDEALGTICNPRDAISQSLIERTVEAAVLTTLLRRHGASQLPAENRGIGMSHVPVLIPEEFDRFLALLVEGDSTRALNWLRPWCHASGRLDDTVAGLLTSAAQKLGKAWEEDTLSFVEVSLGLVTLQQMLHAFELPPASVPLQERHMLLAPVPGESHCFGVRMLGVQFAQAGWNCRCEASLSEDALLRIVSERMFDVVGLSVYHGEGKGLPDLVGRLRKSSREPGVRILLGGALFANQPDLALAHGADLPALPFAELCSVLDRMIPPAG